MNKTCPYSIEELEELLKNVVDYECGEGDMAAYNLEAMGFSEEQMLYFGLPEEYLEQEI